MSIAEQKFMVDAQGRNLVEMRPPGIQNNQPNDIQITAEQLLKDAEIHQTKEIRPPQQRIMDEAELQEYKFRKRILFENRVRRQRNYLGIWIRYAQFEEGLLEFRRARSIFERALEVDPSNIGVWMKYIEMEMRHKFINHARNVFERAIYQMPRIDQFWFKYSYMEEVLGNYQAAREIFNRWMTWKPEEKAWMAFLKFEERMGERENQRQIMYKYMEAFPKLKVYLKVAKFEIKQKAWDSARSIYERTLEELGQEALKEEYFIDFGRFEIRNKEYERAREIFRFGLKNIAKDKAYQLYQEYLAFEKQYGEKDEIDQIILNKRRIFYKELISQNAYNYDAWFDLANLEMSTKDVNRIRDSFEAAIKNVPPGNEKRFWRRYIYLWYNYAVFEELEANNIQKAIEIFERAIQLVPHQQFTFSKLWILYAQLLVRSKDIDKMRKVYGLAIGICPNIKIFQEYIQIELQLANIDRARILYQRFIEIFPDNPIPWIKFAEFENDLEEYERSEMIFELALQNNQMNMPETIWRAYIDNQIKLQNYEKVRELYEKLLERSKHVKIWISYAQFELSIKNVTGFRTVMQRGEKCYIGKPELKEERAILLEQWKDMEVEIGDEQEIKKISDKQPTKTIKKRKIKLLGDESEDFGYEEYYDYIFPEENPQQKNLGMLLNNAKLWKQQQEQKNG
ncbi:unnamed protein product [Paramecium octaurelia]|uniref:Pre-mRNA-splicing factor Syf1-like N-terminal HAT-repeats domain-containing protein n=1 Tax=Paramecium octaurelia TaxID=43137 RepID=A0A8S1S8S4_PAROT|nr:unnamed protein product [Paramecium octaurelia]